MEMLQELYYFPSSPVCRSVIMTAHQLGVQLNLKLVNLLASEQMDPDFVKMNPQHKVPLLCDQGFYLTESRAICIYLVQKYARNDSLYPNDVQQRATVDQRLHFDADIFFRRFAKLYVGRIQRSYHFLRTCIEMTTESLLYRIQCSCPRK